MLRQTRQKLGLIVMAAMLTVSSGLLLAIHLHEADGDHDSHQCDLCIALLSSRQAAIIEPPSSALFDLVEISPAVLTDETIPCSRFDGGVHASRAPPA